MPVYWIAADGVNRIHATMEFYANKQGDHFLRESVFHSSIEITQDALKIFLEDHKFWDLLTHHDVPINSITHARKGSSAQTSLLLTAMEDSQTRFQKIKEILDQIDVNEELCNVLNPRYGLIKEFISYEAAIFRLAGVHDDVIEICLNRVLDYLPKLRAPADFSTVRDGLNFLVKRIPKWINQISLELDARKREEDQEAFLAGMLLIGTGTLMITLDIAGAPLIKPEYIPVSTSLGGDLIVLEIGLLRAKFEKKEQYEEIWRR